MSTKKGMKSVAVIRPVFLKNDLYFQTNYFLSWLKENGFDIEIVKKHKKEGTFSKPILNIISSIVFQLIRLPRAIDTIIRNDFIIVEPELFMIVYVLIAKIFRKKLIINHYASFVTHKEIEGVGRFFPFYLDKIAYKLVNHVIAVSESLKSEIEAKYNLDSEKVKAIYPLINITTFSPMYDEDARNIRKELHLNDKFVVLYHGYHHPWHGVNFLLKAASYLSNTTDINFIIIPKKGRTRLDLNEINSRNIIFLDAVPFDDLPKYIQVANIWCSGFGIHPRGERTLSSTLIQVLAMGKPVITSPNSEDKRKLLTNKETVFFVEPENAKAIADKILCCKENYEITKKVGENARLQALELFTTKKLDEVLPKIFRDKHS